MLVYVTKNKTKMASTSSTQTTAASETTSSTCHEDQFSMQDVKKFCVRQVRGGVLS